MSRTHFDCPKDVQAIEVRLLVFLKITQGFKKTPAAYLTHWRLETPKRVTGKQYRSRLGAAECGVWSGSALFAIKSTIFL